MKHSSHVTSMFVSAKNNWRLKILLVVVLLFVSQLSAQQRSVGSALDIAQSFRRVSASAVNIGSAQGLLLEKSSEILNEPFLKTSGLEAFYVIYPEVGKGYVIVSGDIRMRTILAFSDTDTFRKDSLPDNIRGWFQQYENEMLSLPASIGAPIEDTNWEENCNQSLCASLPIKDNGVSPLLGGIKWDQTSPFNKKCPMDIDGLRCVTGCVATAMAQVMKYHQYPSSGTGSISYTTNSHGLNVSATLGATYHWSEMLDSYSNGYSTAKADEVAQLMFHCGAVLEMDYTSSGSGAYQRDLRNTLNKYFGYDSDMAYVTKSNFTDMSWHTLLLNELNANRPVNYSGSSGLTGHSFVFDGYKSEDGVDVPYYHVNWGWSGYCDGYYLLSSLAPSSTGVGGGNGDYTQAQAMVIGIKAEDNSCGVPVLEGSFSPSATIFRYGENNTFSCNFSITNRACRSFKGDLTLVAKSRTGQETVLKTFQRNTSLLTDYSSSYSGTISIPSSLSVDTYSLELRANYSGNSSYSTVYFPSDYSILIYDESPLLVASAQCSSSSISPAEEYSITLTVKNTGNSIFLGTISAHLHQKNNDVVLTSEPCYIDPNSTSDVVISGLLRTMALGDVSITFTNDLDNCTIQDASGQPLTINTTAQVATADVSVSSMKALTTTSSKVFNVYSYNLLNNSSINFIGDTQLAIIDDNDNILCHIGSMWSNSNEGLPQGYYYSYAREYSGEFPNTIPNGNYRLVTTARQANSGIWSIAKQWYSSEFQYLNVEVSTSSVLIDGVEFEKGPVMGDVNADEEVDVSDVALSVEYALGHNPDPFVIGAADMNHDGTVDELDAEGIVNVILYGIATGYNAPRRDAEENMKSSLFLRKISNVETTVMDDKGNNFSLTDISANQGTQVVVPVLMKNNSKITDFQFDLVLPKGVKLARSGDGDYLFELSSRANSSHVLACAQQPDGSYRFFCYSSFNSLFGGIDGEIMNFTIEVPETASPGECYLQLKNGKMSEVDGSRHISTDSYSFLNILGNKIPINEIRLSQKTIALQKGETMALMAFISPSNASNKKLSWSSSNNSVVSVTQEGVITAQGEGSATITAETTDGSELSVTSIITVLSPGYTDISKINYALYSTETTVISGEVVDVKINLNNENSITSWQADLELPEGVTIAQDGYGEPAVWISGSRTTSSKHSISTSTLSDGSIRLLCTSYTNKIFSGNDGEVATITLNVAESVVAQTCPLVLKNITMVETNSDCHWISRITSRLNVKTYTLGDVNNDGDINSIDLVGIVSFILENPIEGNTREAADLNKDFQINNVDYVTEVNVILGRISLNQLMPTTSSSGFDYLSIESFEIVQAGTTAINVKLDANSSYSSVQFDMILPGGMNVVEGNSLSSSHVLSYNHLENGCYRFLLTSIQNDQLLSQEEILTITLKAEKELSVGAHQIIMEDVYLVNSNAKYVCPVAEDITFFVRDASVIETIAGDERIGNIYNIYGQKTELESNMKSIISNGSRMVDGKLIIVK